MRKFLVLILLFVFALGCGSKGNQAVSGKKSKGELVGIKGKKYFPEKPFGMVLIPGGSYIMGKSDDDLPALDDAPTKTVTVRSLATKNLTKNNFTLNVFKEFNIGILNGVIFAIISSLIVQIWFNDHVLSMIISLSMILTMIVAGLFGILVPVTLKKLNIDPAISSSVFVTTITDVIGFVSFLGVGAYFL